MSSTFKTGRSRKVSASIFYKPISKMPFYCFSTNISEKPTSLNFVGRMSARVRMEEEGMLVVSCLRMGFSGSMPTWQTVTRYLIICYIDCSFLVGLISYKAPQQFHPSPPVFVVASDLICFWPCSQFIY